MRGKFENGAATAAMGYAFNQVISQTARQREAGKGLLLGEDEAPDALTNKLIRKRLNYYQKNWIVWLLIWKK